MTDRQLTPAQERDRIRSIRERWRQRHVDLALAILGPEETRRAAQIGGAFYQLLASARNPDEIMATTEESRIAAIRAMADLDLYPGGASPTCWLIPQRNRQIWEVSLWLSHRGWAILAARDSFVIVTSAVHRDDEIEIEDGLVAHHRADPSRHDVGWADLLGVTVRVMREGFPVLRLWTPRHVIESSRKMAKRDHVWSAHPIAMAQKTAIKHHAARGHIPIDSGAWQRAHEIEMAAEMVQAEVIATTTRRGKALITQQLDVEPEQAERREPVEVDLDAPPPAEWAD